MKSTYKGNIRCWVIKKHRNEVLFDELLSVCGNLVKSVAMKFCL
jgi:hypothetical protein